MIYAHDVAINSIVTPEILFKLETRKLTVTTSRNAKDVWLVQLFPVEYRPIYATTPNYQKCPRVLVAFNLGIGWHYNHNFNSESSSKLLYIGKGSEDPV